MSQEKDKILGSSRGPYRVEWICNLEWEGPLHVGTGERLSVVTDSPLLRDAQGQPYLPGSSVRGVLRDWCEREALVLGIERKHFVRLFGPSTPELKEHDRQARLVVYDARIEAKENNQEKAEIRDHVRIDRKWGAAAKGGKFDQEVALPEKATLRLTYEGDGPDDPELKLLKSAMQALEEGLLAFGAKSGWGMGTVKSASWNKPYICLRSKTADLSSYLKARLGVSDAEPKGAGEKVEAPNPGESVAKTEESTSGEGAAPKEGLATEPEGKKAEKDKARHEKVRLPWSWMRIDLELQFDGPMIVAGPYRKEPGVGQAERAAADAAFQVLPDGTQILAGSSLRGALQAHARRIAMTLGLKHVADRLFGTIKGPGQGSEKGRRGLLRVGEGKLKGDAKTVYLNHVAIDRVTGFAAHSKLFDVAALASPCFVHRLLMLWPPTGEDPLAQAGAALMLLTLRDASEGLLWVGSRTTRGYGHVKDLRVQKLSLSEVKPRESRYRHRPFERRPGPSNGADLSWSTLANDETVSGLMESWRTAAGIPSEQAPDTQQPEAADAPAQKGGAA